MVDVTLNSAIKSGDETAIVSALETISKAGNASPADTKKIKELVVDTKSNDVRNAAAIALADLHVEDAVDLIISLLKTRETYKHRSTLLYALEELNAHLPIDVLVSILRNDPYGAREQALDVLAADKTNYDRGETQKAISELSLLVGSDDDEKASAARKAIHILTESRRFRRF